MHTCACPDLEKEGRRGEARGENRRKTEHDEDNDGVTKKSTTRNGRRGIQTNECMEGEKEGGGKGKIRTTRGKIRLEN
jgi:hypothetical protein